MAKHNPIKSASIILQRTNGEVFLAKRADTVSFFPGFWVFPGGKIEDNLPEDWSGTEFEVIETVYQELFEETGIIVGSDYIVPPSKRKGPYFTFNYDEKKRSEFRASMSYIGKKDTPPFGSKIYSAAYFHIQSPLVDELQPEVDDGELVVGEWLLPEDAIKQWEEGNKRIPPPLLHLLRNMASEHFASITLSETFLPIGLQTKIEFVPGIQAIPFESNTIEPFKTTNLVIIGDTFPLIVDPGANNVGEERFKQILLSLKATPTVYLTHHHRDHIDGLATIESLYPDAVVYAHPDTLSHVSTALTTQTVENKTEIDVDGHHLIILFLPGHTSGSIGIYDRTTKCLVAGDHVVGFGSAVLDPFTGSMIDYFNTTKELLQLDLKVIVPAHGPPVFKPQKLLQQYLDHRQQREDAIYQAVQDGSHSLDAIVETVYQDVPEQMWEYAKRNIVLHLRKLAVDHEIPFDYYI